MKLYIGGDISIGESAPLFAAGDAAAAFSPEMVSAFCGADGVIVNLECAITDQKTEIKKFGPCLAAPHGTGATLQKAGVTLCALSNNHIFDFGGAGLQDTLEELDAAGIPYTGIGDNEEDARRPYWIEKDGSRVAVINVCEHEYSYATATRRGAWAYDPYDTNDDIAEAKKTADYVIVIYHGGKEHCRYPSPRLCKACRSMVKHGADLVLCQHSHCIGCRETFMGGEILYGQGHFHFIKATLATGREETWNNGLLVELTVDKNGGQVAYLPVVTDGIGIRFAAGEEKEALLTAFEERSNRPKTWPAGWEAFCESQTYYKFIPDNIADLFSHYLDCEAHTDVWRTLYPTWNKTNT